ncbi:unnamed protein product, partial [Gongylonema pulchrum]|uniref:All-trans-retinol 13,14-reductase n=1 Tax=Gongylonema pulchrum TaxID=637853 RepID=A0A183EE72_9BILA
MELSIYLVLVSLLSLIWAFRKLRKSKSGENCFLKMVCTEFYPSASDEDWDVIVIGSGLSGLTVAKVLAASGRKVLVLEQHDRAGGSCHTFELDKYEFDVGLFLCLISANNFNARPQVIIGDRYYGRTTGDSKHFCEQLKSWFPAEASNIDDYFQYKCLGANLRFFVAIKMMPAFVVRLLVRSGVIRLFTSVFKYSGQNLLDVMKQYKLSADVQTVIAYYFANYGAPPNRASFFQHHLFLMENGFYPVGGATTITANIIRSINKFGGKVLVKADVQQIVFAAGK